MNLFTSTPKREAIATVKFLPAVSIIMPFAPVITLKKNLEYSLKNVMAKVEAMLGRQYTVEKATPVIIKLRNLISSLNYCTHKKSIAIFVSPIMEKVYYYGVELEEKIVIDPSFTISGLVAFKKEKKEYLVLQLSDTFSRMYLGNDVELKLIKSNILTNQRSCENNTTIKTFSPEADTNKFLVQMDQGLSIILKSYPLPVFVIGKEKLLNDFESVTKNNENLVEFIYGNYEDAYESELAFVMEHYISIWKKLKQQYLLSHIEKAKKQNKLRIGVQEAYEASMVNKGRLLLVEKKLVNHTGTSKTYKAFFKIDSAYDASFFIKDEVDEIIKNVFENGGDVEFVDDGLLEHYNSIALIEDY